MSHSSNFCEHCLKISRCFETNSELKQYVCVRNGIHCTIQLLIELILKNNTIYLHKYDESPFMMFGILYELFQNKLIRMKYISNNTKLLQMLTDSCITQILNYHQSNTIKQENEEKNAYYKLVIRTLIKTMFSCNKQQFVNIFFRSCSICEKMDKMWSLDKFVQKGSDLVTKYWCVVLWKISKYFDEIKHHFGDKINIISLLSTKKKNIWD